ncbi:hypothetical protein Acsp01_82070 [Actinoplanes sp. NBRC 101535]|nr:hypothetical protein Acsp01_82070 [Actinoplanes sp. NBRC 101535]
MRAEQLRRPLRKDVGECTQHPGDHPQAVAASVEPGPALNTDKKGINIHRGSFPNLTRTRQFPGIKGPNRNEADVTSAR